MGDPLQQSNETPTNPTNVVDEAPLNNPSNNNLPNNNPPNNPPINNPLINNPPINNSPNNNPTNNLQSERELVGFDNYAINTEAENKVNQSIQSTTVPAIPEQPVNEHGEVQRSGATAESSSSANSTPPESRPVSEPAPMEDGQVHVINVAADNSADGEPVNHSPNVETEPQDTHLNETTPLLDLRSSTPVLISSAASDEGTSLELLSANRQMPTETPLAPVDISNASDSPPEPSQLTAFTNQAVFEHADAFPINRDERTVFDTYAGLRNIYDHLDERAPDGSVIHEKRELMTRAMVGVAQYFDPRAQRADATTQASDEEPISQPPASQSSQQDAQYTGYKFPRYPLHQNDPRGLCLILNMVTFADPYAYRSRSIDQPAFRQRVGSRADVNNITLIFQNKLHYIVKLEEDLGKTELLNCITYYLQLNDFHANADAFIVFIMSHGVQETIICADGARLKYSELVNLLSQQQCPEMHGKPKLVFIQACQGDKVQLATAVPTELGGLFSSRWATTNGTRGQPSLRHSQSTNNAFRTDSDAASSSSTSPSSSASTSTPNGPTHRPSQSHSQVSQDPPNPNPTATQTSSTRATSSSPPAQPEGSSSTVRPPPLRLGQMLHHDGLFLDSPMEPGNGNANGFIPTRTESHGVEDPVPASDAANASSSNAATPSSSAGTILGRSANPSSLNSAAPPARTPAPRATSAVSGERADAGTAAASASAPAFTAQAFSASADTAAAAPSAASANPQSSSASANFPTLNLAATPFTLQRSNKQPRADVTTLTNDIFRFAQQQPSEPTHSSSIGTSLAAAPLSSQAYNSQRPSSVSRAVPSTLNDPYRAANTRTQDGGAIPVDPFNEAASGLNVANYEPPLSSSSTSLNSSGSNWTPSTSSSGAQLQTQPTPSPAPSGRLPPWGRQNSHTGAGPASAPAHSEPPHASSTSAVRRPSNTPAAFSAESHEHDDDERDHNERADISGSSSDEQYETMNYIPTHGCDLLLGLSSVSDYSSALHDVHGSWYIRSLCEVLDEYAGLPPQGLDIVDMLILVNDRVANTNGQTADNRPFKQMPCIWHNSLRRKFYFDVPVAQEADAQGGLNN